jgi:nitrogen fixation protein NifU and related proteins
LGGLDDLYQQLILDHYRTRRNEGTLDAPTVAVDHNNPLCGDELHLELLIEDGRVADVRQSGQGCSISQAAASMMTEVAKGLPLDDALAVVEHFRLVMHGEEEADEERLGDAIALEGVAKYPVRIKCALLGWMALKDAIETYRSNEN